MIRLAVTLPVIALALAAWAHWPERPLPAEVRADRVVVSKSDRTLSLYSGDALLRTYQISLGRNPLGTKTQQGDGRTPEGLYFIDYHKADSSFHRALHVSYPSASDLDGAKARSIDPGGLIMVHGIRNGLGWLGRAHRLVDWTDGCIAVTDSEIEEIYRAVSDGTPIEIRP